MATASFGREIAVVPVATRWWQRQDTYTLAVVAAVHAAAGSTDAIGTVTPFFISVKNSTLPSDRYA
jgi:cadmium resistance protein CadD (predicted permease)